LVREFQTTYNGDQVSPELRPLILAVYDSIYSNPLDESQVFENIKLLLQFLSTPQGQTDPNCHAVDWFFAFGNEDNWPNGENRWDHLSPNLREALESLGDALHDTISAPTIAQNFGATPAQQLVRLDYLQRLLANPNVEAQPGSEVPRMELGPKNPLSDGTQEEHPRERVIRGGPGELEVSFSISKLILLALGSLMFVAVSILIWILTLDAPLILSIFFKISVLAGFAFFGFAFCWYASKLLANKPGLIVDQNGIIDNSNAYSESYIFWDDIIRIETGMNFASYKFIAIIVKDPKNYINRAGLIKKWAYRYNMKYFRSPILINSIPLKMGHHELAKEIQRLQEFYRKD